MRKKTFALEPTLDLLMVSSSDMFVMTAEATRKLGGQRSRTWLATKRTTMGIDVCGKFAE